jgi:hypothetical protein
MKIYIIGSLLIVCTALAAGSNWFPKVEEIRLECVMIITDALQNIEKIGADPEGKGMEYALSFLACAGSDVWDYAAPFIGGAGKPFAAHLMISEGSGNINDVG